MLEAVRKFFIGSGPTSILPPEEIARLIQEGALLLDVRMTRETKKGIAPGARNIPVSSLKDHLKDLPRDKTIVTYCNRGGRAGKAKDILEANGFKAANGGGYKTILKILKG